MSDASYSLFTIAAVVVLALLFWLSIHIFEECDYKSFPRRFWAWYNRQCSRRYVGLLMIPLTIGAVFLPFFIFIGLSKHFHLIQ